MAKTRRQASSITDDDIVVALPTTLFDGLPPMPPANLDPYLDAAARCFARFGVGRTSVQDVAKEMGYNRATVYRQVGTVENQARLLAARDAYRAIARLPGYIDPHGGPETFIDLVARVVEEAWEHPVLAKVLADEPELLTALVSRYLPELRDKVIAMLGPVLEAAMDRGQIARRDPEVLASVALRLVVTLGVLPPEKELRPFLAEILGPLLEPATK